MKLHLNLAGVEVSLQIKNYIKKLPNEDMFSNWCKTDFSFTSGDWLNYSQDNSEIFLPHDIDTLANLVEDLLNDRLDKSIEYECVEPDFTFILNPKKDLRNDPEVLYVRPGCEIVDIDAEWKISFWHDGLTANYLSLSLDRGDIENLLYYLRLITGELKEDDPKIQHLIRDGILS